MNAYANGGQRRVALVVLIWLLYLGFAWCWQDIGFFDETIYLFHKNTLTPSSFIDGLENAPLYADWYRLLAHLVADPVWLYFFSWAVLLSLVLWLPLLAGVPGAWLFALVMMVLPVFKIWPYVSLFAAIWLLLGLLLVWRARLSLPATLLVAAGVGFIVAFARAEYAYSAYFPVLALLLLLLTRQVAATRTNLALFLPLALLASLLSWLAHASDHGRSGIAFAQHVNKRAVESGALVGENPWTSTYAMRVFGLDTRHGAADTSARLTDFLHADPHRFFAHVLSNVCDPVLLALMLVALALLISCWRQRSQRPLRAEALYVGLLLLPTLAACALIYPRLHYLVTVAPVLVLLALLRWQPAHYISTAMAWILLVFCLPLMVVVTAGAHLLKSHQLSAHVSLVTIQCLRSTEARYPLPHMPLSPTSSPVLLDATGHATDYLRSSWRVLDAATLSSYSNLQQLVASSRPDWVVASPELSDYVHLDAQALDQRLRTDLGYRSVQCPSPSQVRIYIRTLEPTK